MGGCLSSESSSSDHSSRNLKYSPANVVSVNGELSLYSLPVTVSQVLQSQTQTSSPADSFFLCNSDLLNFDDYIPSLDHQEELEPAQIYFVLPTTKLQYRLSASDMAALAVKASVALEHTNPNSNRRRRKRKIRISPVLVSSEDPKSSHTTGANSSYSQINSAVNQYRDHTMKSSAGLGISRSGSVKKLSRYSSRRAKLAVRSFKLKLTTIYEGSVLLLT